MKFPGNFYPLIKEYFEDLAIMESDPIAKNSPKAIKIDNCKEVQAADGTWIDMSHLNFEMESAKTGIISHSPLFGPYVHEFIPIYTWSCPTMATDGIRLFVNPQFANELSWEGKIFVIIHEIMHCVLDHINRKGTRDHEKFNIAGDYEINALIIETLDDFDENFIRKDIGGLYESKYLNWGAEQIYADLDKTNGWPKLQPPPPQPGQGQPGQGQPGQGQPGQGQPGQGQPGGNDPGHAGIPGAGAGGSNLGSGHGKLADGTIVDNVGGAYEKQIGQDAGQAGKIISKEQAKKMAKKSGYGEDEMGEDQDVTRKWENVGRDMLDRNENRTAGKGMGESMLNRLKELYVSEVNWKKILSKYVGDALSPQKQWRLPNKKHLSRGVLRRGTKDKYDAINKIIVAVDTSGSMSDEEVKKALSEINGIIFSKRARSIEVLFYTDGVYYKQKLKPGAKKYFPPKRITRGGTNWQALLDYVKTEYHDNVSLFINLTDGGDTAPRRPRYHRKFIWLIWGNDSWKENNFGKLITMPDKI